MKKFILLPLLISILFGSINENLFEKKTYITDKTIKEIKISNSYFKNRPDIDILYGIKDGDFYNLKIQLKKYQITAFLNISSDILIIGKKMYKNTEIKLKEKQQYDLNLLNIISFSYGSGPDLFVLIDPLCPYAKRLMTSNKLDGFKVNVIFVSTELRPQSNLAIAWIDQADSFNRFFKVINGSEEYEKKYQDYFSKLKLYENKSFPEENYIKNSILTHLKTKRIEERKDSYDPTFTTFLLDFLSPEKPSFSHLLTDIEKNKSLEIEKTLNRVKFRGTPTILNVYGQQILPSELK